jgi:hypothetical protein
LNPRLKRRQKGENPRTREDRWAPAAFDNPVWPLSMLYFGPF